VDQVVASGFFVGVVYGLVAIGLVVTYRCSRIINFAYGEIGMIGAFVFAELWADHGVGLGFALAAGIGVSTLLGGITELVIVRPLRDRPRLSAMVGTLAMGVLLLTYAARRYGATPRYTLPIISGEGIEVFGVFIQRQQLLILAVALLVIVALWALQRFTSFGLRLRATALDPYAAGLSGVNNDLTSLLTWTIAGALAGLSAILILPTKSVDVYFMTELLLRSLAAALIGGLTSIGGAFGAGILLGVAEAVIGYKSPVIGLTEVIIAGFVILLLLVRPQGLVRSRY